MKRSIRYGDYLSAVRTRQRPVSYNAVIAADTGRARRMRLRPRDLYRLLGPYFGTRLADQLRAVIPLALFLAVFAAAVLRTTVHDAAMVSAGIIAVIAGLMLFLEGIQHGLMPFSENIGYNMPSRSSVPAILGVAMVLGAAATFAEPAIGALEAAGSLTDASRAPRLHSLLRDHSGSLVLVVALSVGLAVLTGILRVIMNWRLKSLIILTLAPCIALTAYFALQPEYAAVLGLAWDCGAITTGPVTVPLVVALGIGVAAAAGKEDNPLAGFGIVTLASLFPALGVMLLALWLPMPAAELHAAAPTPGLSWYEASPWSDLVAALRAIAPLTLLLWLIQTVWVRDARVKRDVVSYGILLSIIGMFLFNLGLQHGLTPLGNHTGSLLPAAFTSVTSVKDSPLYLHGVGVPLVLAFALALGFGATLAEPALTAMGITVENLTDGVFRKRLVVRTVAIGVAAGTALGTAKVLFNLPLAALLLPAYVAALIMTVASSEEFVNLAWDSAGVTTGPVTVPLVLAMGLGLGSAVNATDGFGILALASVGPIISVLAVGLWIRRRVHGSRR